MNYLDPNHEDYDDIIPAPPTEPVAKWTEEDIGRLEEVVKEMLLKIKPLPLDNPD